ncbi:hypothetical protein ACFX43_01800 [Nocardioides sp. YIM B13467]|uniref:hypothetical protein n=1 Tax=Nocardioides sp. YIM B13467 TaxID=3366294 RepID=UPI003671B606
MSDSKDLQAAFAREDAARMLIAQRRMQDRVTSYAQLTVGGLSRIDIERAVRRNELRRGRDDGRPIHVAIDHSRKLMPQPGIVVHRMRDLERKAYGGTPPHT